MPAGAFVPTTTPTVRHVSVFAAWKDLTDDLIMPSVSITDAAGDGAEGTFTGVLNLALSSLTSLYANAFVIVFDHDIGKTIFRGFLKSYHSELSPTWSPTRIVATDHGELLDRYIPGPVSRPAESAIGRLAHFWAYYSGSYLSPDFTYVTNIGTVPPATYEGITLRRLIDAVVAQASSTTGRWYLDQVGRLHTYTAEVNAAPFNIKASAPGAGEIDPEDLEVDNDGMNYANAVYVNAATPEASGWVRDYAAIAKNGGQEVTTTIDAPDAITIRTTLDATTMRNYVGAAYLARVTSAQQRGRFSTTSPNDGWLSGQTLTVNAPNASFNRATRLVRVTTTFLSSAIRSYSIEFEAPWRRQSKVNTTATALPGHYTAF